MKLGIDDDELAVCVACGLCLPHCPTYRVTGEEALSPRGRIAAMRQVQWADAEPDEAFFRSIDTCVQCRGCEPACPSGVPFGRLVEATKATLATGVAPSGRQHAPANRKLAAGPVARATGSTAKRGVESPSLRLALRTLGHHRLVLAGSTALAVAQRLWLLRGDTAKRLGLPVRLPLRRPALRPSGTDVWLFTGCVMDAWQRDVHVAVLRVIGATGAGVALPGTKAGCCGALSEHAGLSAQALALARRTMTAFPGEAPILVDAAGCGAMLKDYGRVLGTDEAHAFSARVLDVHEWLAERIDRLPPSRRHQGRVAVQDPCHLRHVQRAHGAVRTVLSGYAELVELDDDGLCCGAGGAYALLQPDLAGAIRARKLAAIARSGAPLVASANPGCALHLAAGGATVAHPCEVVARAL